MGHHRHDMLQEILCIILDVYCENLFHETSLSIIVDSLIVKLSNNELRAIVNIWVKFDCLCKFQIWFKP